MTQLMVLGLDPGSRCTGYGLVAECSGVLELIKTGTIRPPMAEDLSVRLGAIFWRLSEIIREFSPQEAAVENVFVSRNTASALKLGQARGAALVACAAQNIPVGSYEPTLIKKTIVGVGRAEKSQVAFMVGQMLGRKPNWSRDSSDALAAAICHLNQRRWNKIAEAAR